MLGFSTPPGARMPTPSLESEIPGSSQEILLCCLSNVEAESPARDPKSLGGDIFSLPLAFLLSHPHCASNHISRLAAPKRLATSCPIALLTLVLCSLPHGIFCLNVPSAPLPPRVRGEAPRHVAWLGRELWVSGPGHQDRGPEEWGRAGARARNPRTRGAKSLFRRTGGGQFALVAVDCLNELNGRQGGGQHFLMEEAAWGGKRPPLALSQEPRMGEGTLPLGVTPPPSNVPACEGRFDCIRLLGLSRQRTRLGGLNHANPFSHNSGG